MHAERFDALVTFAGCDKSLPGMLMAAARLNLPAVFLYGGSILPGQHNGPGPRHRRACSRPSAPSPPARIDRGGAGRRSSATPARPRARCAGMFTANTMASVGRGDRHVAARLGVGPRPSTAAATTSPTSRARRSSSCSSQNIRPRQILTKEAFENAIAVTMALGGSTNAVLHLLAIANEARVELELDDFNRVAATGAPHRRHEAARPVPHDRPRPRRRRARRA